MSAEERRLEEDARRDKNWKRWGPYLSERQWGTVREDYSPGGSCWEYFSHDHARSRVYRWGEDGLLGITDRECRLCFGLGLWNGKDPILKERLFGLTGPQGNHGEDVKECYYYLDSTPTHSYMKALYKYPQGEFPYGRLVEENQRRGKDRPEFELVDTGIFNDSRYFDVMAEYAKDSPNDILIRVTVSNRGPDAATIHVLGQLWFRNIWVWGRKGEGFWAKAHIARVPRQARDERAPLMAIGEEPLTAIGEDPLMVSSSNHDDVEAIAEHESLGRYRFHAEKPDELIFTENETNEARVFGGTNKSPYVKDAFHDYVVHGRKDVVNAKGEGTKTAAMWKLDVPARGSITIRLRLSADGEAADPMIVEGAGTHPHKATGNVPAHAGKLPAHEGDTSAMGRHIAGSAFGKNFDRVFDERIREADKFYAARIPSSVSEEERRVSRQAYAGLLWGKQYYHYVVKDWIEGDPAQPSPPDSRKTGRNKEWFQLHCRDVLSMPDKWEYPWFAAWDSAFHMIPYARIDPQFAKDQLVLFLREWYMHPNGQIPAYEFAFSDVNPPVHAWGCWRVYKMTGEKGKRDRAFLERVFHKLIINFTWWVNRKDLEGNNLFSGGFLGLDNIGVFDRSKPLPTGGHLEQADGTSWMAFYCATMLSMALELAREDPAYEDVASKFFEHFVAISDAMNSLGGSGLWDERDGFYYDRLNVHGKDIPLRVRSLVGLSPLFAAEILEDEVIDRLPSFKKRMKWFIENRKDLARQITHVESVPEGHEHAHRGHRLLAIPSRDRLERVLRYLFDENEFLSPHGIRSLSRVHKDSPYIFRVGGAEHRVDYVPADSDTGLFGGNSNWRGPVWFPMNYLIIEALERYHHFYGESLQVECPTGSGRFMNLKDAAAEISRRLASVFMPDKTGRRPSHGDDTRYAKDPNWKDLVLFYEYFHGDTGLGVGASHQTGWTSLVTRCIEKTAGR